MTGSISKLQNHLTNLHVGFFIIEAVGLAGEKEREAVGQVWWGGEAEGQFEVGLLT